MNIKGDSRGFSRAAQNILGHSPPSPFEFDAPIQNPQSFSKENDYQQRQQEYNRVFGQVDMEYLSQKHPEAFNAYKANYLQQKQLQEAINAQNKFIREEREKTERSNSQLRGLNMLNKMQLSPGNLDLDFNPRFPDTPERAPDHNDLGGLNENLNEIGRQNNFRNQMEPNGEQGMNAFEGQGETAQNNQMFPPQMMTQPSIPNIGYPSFPSYPFMGMPYQSPFPNYSYSGFPPSYPGFFYNPPQPPQFFGPPTGPVPMPMAMAVPSHPGLHPGFSTNNEYLDSAMRPESSSSAKSFRSNGRRAQKEAPRVAGAAVIPNHEMETNPHGYGEGFSSKEVLRYDALMKEMERQNNVIQKLAERVSEKKSKEKKLSAEMEENLHLKRLEQKYMKDEENMETRNKMSRLQDQLNIMTQMMQFQAMSNAANNGAGGGSIPPPLTGMGLPPIPGIGIGAGMMNGGMPMMN